MPTLHDRYDLPLGTSSSQAAAAYGDGLDRMLAMQVGAEKCFTKALTADEGFALAYAALAIIAFTTARMDEARAHSTQSQDLASGLGRRERQHVAAINALVSGDAPLVRSLLQEHLAEFPRDALLLRLQTQQMMMSDLVDRQARTFALVKDLDQNYGEDWWFLGQYSMAQEEAGHYEVALQWSERSLALRPDCSPAAHGVAHVHYETNAHETGAQFLTEWLGAEAGQSTFAGHLTWHYALHELALGHEQQAISLYEQTLAPESGNSPTALLDTASFIWRWQLYGLGADVPSWAPVVALANQSAEKPGKAFFDAHAALAFVGSGEWEAMSRLLDGLRGLAGSKNDLVAEVVIPLVEGMAAFGHGDYAAAVQQLEPIADQIVRIGGSHAQREVFEDTLIQAQLRSGQAEQAADRLRRRLERRHSARDSSWLLEARPDT